MKKRSLNALMFSFCLFAFGCGSDKSSSPKLVSPLTGSSAGQKMPPFVAHDQFGHEVSSETLKGSRGVVFLFFRSADW